VYLIEDWMACHVKDIDSHISLFGCHPDKYQRQSCVGSLKSYVVKKVYSRTKLEGCMFSISGPTMLNSLLSELIDCRCTFHWRL